MAVPTPVCLIRPFIRPFLLIPSPSRRRRPSLPLTFTTLVIFFFSNYSIQFMYSYTLCSIFINKNIHRHSASVGLHHLTLAAFHHVLAAVGLQLHVLAAVGHVLAAVGLHHLPLAAIDNVPAAVVLWVQTAAASQNFRKICRCHCLVFTLYFLCIICRKKCSCCCG